jgi:hypothetical protein
MPSAPINNQGAVLLYEDSGAPPGSTDYVTVFMLSAYLWHGGTPERSVTMTCT